MPDKPNSGDNLSGGNPSDVTAKSARRYFWRWLVLHLERQMHQRRVRREKRKIDDRPEEQAARRTATATVWIAVFTVVLAAVGALTLFEVIEGGTDTHNLAVAAGNQATWTQRLATSAGTQADRTKDLADRMKEQADRTKTMADQAIVQANAGKELAQNSVDTLHNTQNAFRDEQRAWIGVEGTNNIKGFSETEPWRVTVIFFNSGRTPARNVQTSGMFITSPVPIAGPSEQQAAQLTFRPAQSIAPQGNYREAIGADFAGEAATPHQILGQQTLLSQYNQIKNRELFLYYFGVLKYDDVFGKTHQTQFCIMLADPATKEVGICDAFNDLN